MNVKLKEMMKVTAGSLLAITSCFSVIAINSQYGPTDLCFDISRYSPQSIESFQCALNRALPKGVKKVPVDRSIGPADQEAVNYMYKIGEEFNFEEFEFSNVVARKKAKEIQQKEFEKWKKVALANLQNYRKDQNKRIAKTEKICDNAKEKGDFASRALQSNVNKTFRENNMPDSVIAVDGDLKKQTKKAIYSLLKLKLFEADEDGNLKIKEKVVDSKDKSLEKRPVAKSYGENDFNRYKFVKQILLK